MIAHLNGKLIHKSTETVVVDVGGVGYELFIPLTTYSMLPPPGSPLALSVHTHLKDDSIQLYGFMTREEKEVFRLLISVTGVGPKLARNILSGIPVADLISAISRGDKARLSSIPGIGGKTAERLLLELKDKAANMTVFLNASRPGGDVLSNDVISALSNLGYKSHLAGEAVEKAKALLPAACGFEELLKESLKTLSKR
ncbi:MAG: Holliday junction branch migration protein RuvA [Deltaproteobacteria bacterium]|nr:Holliday junction branch migration protein RuvA [Deltaproteobacteria bacterium]